MRILSETKAGVYLHFGGGIIQWRTVHIRLFSFISTQIMKIYNFTFKTPKEYRNKNTYMCLVYAHYLQRLSRIWEVFLAPES
jgi:hypothetical protein